jgi:hypothetical protein
MTTNIPEECPKVDKSRLAADEFAQWKKKEQMSKPAAPAKRENGVSCVTRADGYGFNWGLMGMFGPG